MTQTNVFLNLDQDDKVKYYQYKWRLTKQETIQKIIDNFYETRNDKIKLEAEKNEN